MRQHGPSTLEPQLPSPSFPVTLHPVVCLWCGGQRPMLMLKDQPLGWWAQAESAQGDAAPERHRCNRRIIPVSHGGEARECWQVHSCLFKGWGWRGNKSMWCRRSREGWGSSRPKS